MESDPNRTFLSWGNIESSSWCNCSNVNHCLESLVVYCVSHSFKIWKSDSCNGWRTVSADLNLNVKFPIFIIENGQPKITLKALFCIFALLIAIGLNSKSTVHSCCFPHAAEIVQYYFGHLWSVCFQVQRNEKETELIHWKSMGELSEHVGWRVDGAMLAVKGVESTSKLRKWWGRDSAKEA